MLISTRYSFNIVKLSLGITLTAAGIFAFIASWYRHRKQVQLAYHEIHALAITMYGVAILFFSHTFESLISFTSFLFIFYAFSEVIFCIWLFNLAQHVIFKIVILRVLLGLIVGVGTVVSMPHPEFTLQIFGLLFVLIGLNIILYVPIMKEYRPKRITKEFS